MNSIKQTKKKSTGPRTNFISAIAKSSLRSCAVKREYQRKGKNIIA